MLPETSYAAEWDVVGVNMVENDGSAEVNVENAEEGPPLCKALGLINSGKLDLSSFHGIWPILRGLKTLAGQQSLFCLSLLHSS
jgi:hypothetical protein